MTHHMRNLADRVAAQSYATCAPTLFDCVESGVELGYTRDDMSAGRNYRTKVTDAGVIADVQAAAEHIAGKAQQRTLAFFAKHLG